VIHYLLLYQFPFLYCVTIALGLVVYGSDFDEVAGNLYLVPLLLLPLLHWFVVKLLKPLTSVAVTTGVLLAGAVVALLAYRQLHFSYWDEHSLSQAILLACLGLLSYLASVVACIRLSMWRGDHRRASAGAWLVLGLCWMLAFYYPMSSLFVMAVILAVASLWAVAGSVDVEMLRPEKIPATGQVKYLVFLLMLDLSLVVWDYQVNTGWAWHLSNAMITAALGCWLAFKSTSKHLYLMTIIVMINFIATMLWPGLILHHLHSALIGVCLGWSIGYLVNAAGVRKHLPVVSAAMPVFLGLALGYAVYANLAYASWRVVFLLPLLFLWFTAKRKDAPNPAVIS